MTDGYVRGYAGKTITQTVVETARQCPSLCLAVYRYGRETPVPHYMVGGNAGHDTMAWLNRRRRDGIPVWEEELREHLRAEWRTWQTRITVDTTQKTIDYTGRQLENAVVLVAANTRGQRPVVVEETFTFPLGYGDWQAGGTIDNGFDPVPDPAIPVPTIAIDDYKFSVQRGAWSKEKAADRAQTGLYVVGMRTLGYEPRSMCYLAAESGDRLGFYEVDIGSRAVRSALADATATAILLDEELPLRGPDCSKRCPFGGDCLG